MLEYYGLELNEEVKAMYNGYRFGDEEIYNPWSVLNYARPQGIGALLGQHEQQQDDPQSDGRAGPDICARI